MNGPSQIAFDVEATRWAWVLGAYTCNKIPNPTEHNPGLSPDGKWQAEVKITTSICETPPLAIRSN
jgi:hypothetical protein